MPKRNPHDYKLQSKWDQPTHRTTCNMAVGHDVQPICGFHKMERPKLVLCSLKDFIVCISVKFECLSIRVE